MDAWGALASIWQALDEWIMPPLMLGLGWLGAWLVPRVTKAQRSADLAKAGLDALQAQAEGALARSEAMDKLEGRLARLDGRVQALEIENQTLRHKLVQLAGDLDAKERKLKVRIEHMKQVLLDHIESWRNAVCQTTVDPAIQEHILSAVKPLPEGWDREE